MISFLPYDHNKSETKVELDLSNYAIKYVTVVDTSQFAKKGDLANSKSEADKLDFNEFKKCTKWFKQFKE